MIRLIIALVPCIYRPPFESHPMNNPDKTFNSTLRKFLRGGQVILHTVHMFGQLIKILAFLTMFLMVAIVYIGVSSSTTKLQRHYALKYYWATAYELIGINDQHILDVALSEDIPQPMSVSKIISDPVIIANEGEFRKVLVFWLAVGIVVCLTGVGGLVVVFIKRGGLLTQTKHMRGATLSSDVALRTEITLHNRRMKRRLSLKSKPYELVSIPYPSGSEVQHTVISGTIGSGKTQAISSLVEQIRSRGDRAIVFDITGSYVGPFYRPDRDIILNPLDVRSPCWSVFSEASSKTDFDFFAQALIPASRSNDPIWVDSARLLVSTAGQLLSGDGKTTNKDLVDTLTTSSISELEKFFLGTPVAAIVSPETPRMTNSIRMTVNTYLDGLRLLPEDGKAFSISDWINSEEKDSILYLSSRADIHQSIRPLLTVWFDTAVRALMSAPKKQDQRIWFIIDEVPALNAMPSIVSGMSRGRQFGAAFLLGVQAQSQLREIYGRDGAQSLSSVARTKLVLSASDAETARLYADFLGREETYKPNENVSFGADSVRDGVVVTRQERTQHQVMPEEIMNLPSLEGFLKFPEGFPITKVKIPLVVRSDNEPNFIPRADIKMLVKRKLPVEQEDSPETAESTTERKANYSKDWESEEDTIREGSFSY